MKNTCDNCCSHNNCKIEEWYSKQSWKRNDFACNGFVLKMSDKQMIELFKAYADTGWIFFDKLNRSDEI